MSLQALLSKYHIIVNKQVRLQTQRLLLKELCLADLEQVHLLHSLPETDQFNTMGIPATIQVTELLLTEWIEQQKAIPRISYVFSVNLTEPNQFIGLIGLKPGKPAYRIAEAWYKTHPAYWRQGYSTEALIKLLEFGFIDLQLHRIEAGCAVENIASIRVLEKVGMIREGRKRKILPIRGSWTDNYFYSILETDFAPSG
jgi:ribosomal-protein-alanine N-acetyltransferase